MKEYLKKSQRFVALVLSVLISFTMMPNVFALNTGVAGDRDPDRETVKAGYTLKGVVKDSAGKVVSGASVKLTGGTKAKTVKTTTKGAYTFTGVAKGTSYVLTATKAGFEETKTSKFSVTKATTKNITLKAIGYDVTVIVKNEDGKAVKNAEVTLKSTATTLTGKTNAYGKVVLAKASKGYYTGTVKATGYEDAKIDRFNVTKAVTKNVELTKKATEVTVTGLAITAAPTKVTYTAGEKLDLTGLSVTLTMSDDKTEVVPFASFATKGIETTPANGADLAVTDTKVTVTHKASTKSADQAITVTAADADQTAVDAEKAKYEAAVTVANTVAVAADVKASVVKVKTGQTADAAVTVGYAEKTDAGNYLTTVDNTSIALAKQAAAGATDNTAVVTLTFTKNGKTATLDVTVTIQPLVPVVVTVAEVGTITSGNAVNDATVLVTFNAAPTTAPVVTDFAVLVNGAANVVKTVTAVTGQTKQFKLTLTDKLLETEGTFTVNGVAPANVNGGTATTTSENKVDFKKPTITDVTATNKLTAKVTFSEKLNKETAETAANFTIRRIATGTAYTVLTAVLAEDGKTVTLILDSTTPLIDSINGFSLTLSNTIKDAAANATNVTERIFSGNGNEDTSLPTAVSADFDASSKEINVSFSRVISLRKVNVDATKFAVGATTLTADAYPLDVTPDSNKLTLKLTAAEVTAISGYAKPLTLTIGANAVAISSDVTVKNAAATAPLNVATKPMLTAAAYDQISKVLTLTFNEDIDVTKVTKSGISLALTAATVSTVTLGADDLVTSTTNGKTVTIQLAATNATAVEATAVTARVVKLASDTVKAVNMSIGNIAETTGIAVTYTKDTTKPAMVSASYNNLTSQLTLTFSKYMKQATVADMVPGNVKFSIDNVTDKASAAGAALTTNADPKKVILTLSNTEKAKLNSLTAEERAKLRIAFVADTFFDTAANGVSSLTYANAFTVSFIDQVKPTLVFGAAANNSSYMLYDIKTGLAAADGATTADSTHIVVNFSTAMSSTATVTTNYTVALADNPAVTYAVSKVSLDAAGTLAVLTVAEMPSDQIVSVTVNTAVASLAGNTISTDTSTNSGRNNVGYIKVKGTLASTTGPTLQTTNTTFADIDASGSVTPGDTLTLTFNKNLVLSTGLSNSDFVVKTISAGGVAVEQVTGFGSGATFTRSTSDPTKLVIAIGNGCQITAANVTTTGNILINLLAAGTTNITDLYSNKAMPASSDVANFGYSATRPTISKAIYLDSNNSGLIDIGDDLQITFSDAIKSTGTFTTATSGTADSILLGSSAEFASAAGVLDATKKILTFKITAGSGLGADDTFSIIHNATANKIQNLWSQDALATTAKTVEKADTVQPEIKSAYFVDQNNDDEADIGDQIVITFSEAVNASGSLATALEFGSANLTEVTAVMSETTGLVATGSTNLWASMKGADGTKLILTCINDTAALDFKKTKINTVAAGASAITDAQGNPAKVTASLVTIDPTVTTPVTKAITATATTLSMAVAAASSTVPANVAITIPNAVTATVGAYTLTNQGTITVASGGTLSNTTDTSGLVNEGTINVSGTLTNTEELTNHKNLTILNGGVITTALLSVDDTIADTEIISKAPYDLVSKTGGFRVLAGGKLTVDTVIMVGPSTEANAIIVPDTNAFVVFGNGSGGTTSYARIEGNATLQKSLVLAADTGTAIESLGVRPGATLTIPTGVTLTNAANCDINIDGVLVVNSGGAIVNSSGLLKTTTSAVQKTIRLAVGASVTTVNGVFTDATTPFTTTSATTVTAAATGVGVASALRAGDYVAAANVFTRAATN